MYRTIARIKLKPVLEQALIAEFEAFASANVPGFISEYLYRMDDEPNTLYIAAFFQSKEAYVVNAGSPEQHERYLKMSALLESDSEWHDGQVIFPQKETP